MVTALPDPLLPCTSLCSWGPGGLPPVTGTPSHAIACQKHKGQGGLVYIQKNRFQEACLALLLPFVFRPHNKSR